MCASDGWPFRRSSILRCRRPPPSNNSHHGCADDDGTAPARRRPPTRGHRHPCWPQARDGSRRRRQPAGGAAAAPGSQRGPTQADGRTEPARHAAAGGGRHVGEAAREARRADPAHREDDRGRDGDRCGDDRAGAARWRLTSTLEEPRALEERCEKDRRYRASGGPRGSSVSSGYHPVSRAPNGSSPPPEATERTRQTYRPSRIDPQS